MKDYEHIFENCENKFKNKFDKFREEEEFSFLVNNNSEPDNEALQLGKSFDNNLFQKYLNVKKSRLGFSNKIPYVDLDNLDSKHYMMSCFIFSYFLKENIDIKNILEIGGGFGNWCYINQDIINFEKWCIIDLEFVTKLQKWFLNKEMKEINKVSIYNTQQLDEINTNFDLLICSHSLSEISKLKFNIYMKKIIKTKVKYFFYAYHMTLPNKNLITYKKKEIEKVFTEIKSFYSEEKRVHNILYIKK